MRPSSAAAVADVAAVNLDLNAAMRNCSGTFHAMFGPDGLGVSASALGSCVALACEEVVHGMHSEHSSSDGAAGAMAGSDAERRGQLRHRWLLEHLQHDRWFQEHVEPFRKAMGYS